MRLSIEKLRELSRDGEAMFKACSIEDAVSMANELIAMRELKGGSVPVLMDALRDAVAEMSGGLPLEWREGTAKGHNAVPFINFNSLHRIVSKFTAPHRPACINERIAFSEWLASDYSPDGSGRTSQAEERGFLELLWHVWQARASLNTNDYVIERAESNDVAR